MSNTLYPASIDAPVDPIGTNPLSSPDHAGQHSFENDAIVALETKVGVDSSAVTTTIDYKLKNTASHDPGHQHTPASLLPGTLTANQILQVNSGGTAFQGYNAPTFPSGAIVGTTDSQTLTNKTIAGGSNTISGITEAMQSLSDVTTDNVSTTKHGYAPKGTNTGVQFLRDDGTYAGFSNLISASAVATGITIPGTTTFTNILGVTIPANTLGTAGIVVMRIRVSMTLKDGASVTLPFKVLYGSNALSTFTATGSTTSTFDGWIEIFLQGNGSTSSQNIMASLIAQVAGSTTLAAGNITGTTSTDSTSNQSLAIQTESTNGNPSITIVGYTVNKL